MADTTLSPNMNLPVPTVSQAPGPDWAEDINACLAIVDQHSHASGQGVPITPDGIDINTDLPFDNNNATQVKSVRFYVQNSTFASSVLGALYESGVDLYFNDGNGNTIRITQGGAVAGSTGTITGLPSGTASASYAAGTFTFQSATNTPAAMSFGPITIGEQVASPNKITVQSPTALAAAYSVTLFTALPAGVRYVTLDNSGNLAYNTVAATGSGAPVLANSPTLTTPTINGGTLVAVGGSLSSPTITTPAFVGVPTGTITATTYVPTVTFTYNTGSTTSFSVVARYAYYLRIGNVVTVFVEVDYSGVVSGPGSYYASISIPVATSSLLPAGVYSERGNISAGPVSAPVSPYTTSTVGALNSFPTISSGSSTFSFQFSYLIS